MAKEASQSLSEPSQIWLMCRAAAPGEIGPGVFEVIFETGEGVRDGVAISSNRLWYHHVFYGTVFRVLHRNRVLRRADEDLHVADLRGNRLITWIPVALVPITATLFALTSTSPLSASAR